MISAPWSIGNVLGSMLRHASLFAADGQGLESSLGAKIFRVKPAGALAAVQLARILQL